MVRFEARVETTGADDTNGWWVLNVPDEVREKVGKTRRVRGTLNGFAFRCPLLAVGGGVYGINPTRAVYREAGVGPGDLVAVALEADPEANVVELPAELETALARRITLRRRFEGFSAAHRREYANWIGSAKRPETRAARASKALEMIAERKHP